MTRYYWGGNKKTAPLRREHPATPAAIASRRRRTNEGLMDRVFRILLVDDNELVLKHVSFHLNQEPSLSVVGTATTGRTAVAMAAVLAPDVVLLDLMMPGLDGFETIPLLRETVPEAQIIALTSLEGDAYVERARTAGFDAYVLKARMADMLVATIRAQVSAEKSNGA